MAYWTMEMAVVIPTTVMTSLYSSECIHSYNAHVDGLDSVSEDMERMIYVLSRQES